jgi:Zn-dependent protease
MTPQEIYAGILWWVILLFSLSFHEFGHAWTALRKGDPTAKMLGRVTLNPAAHADLIGTVILPLVQIFTGVPLIGWAKPVPFDARNLRRPGRDSMWIATAGPGFNLILAVAAAFLLRLNGFLAGFDAGILATLYKFLDFVLPRLVHLNVSLAFFNLIPMPPLDGSYVLDYLLPHRMKSSYREFAGRWGFLAVLVLVYTGVAGMLVRLGHILVGPFLNAVAGS